MKKQELLQLHGLYRKIVDFVGEDPEGTAYDELGVGPENIKVPKDDHKKALYMLSHHLGNNFEGIERIDWEFDEILSEPDAVSGKVALYTREDKAHDTLVLNYDSEEELEIDISEEGKHSQKYQVLCDLAKGCGLDEALQIYERPNRRIRKYPFRELDEVDVDGENLRYVLEQSKA